MAAMHLQLYTLQTSFHDCHLCPAKLVAALSSSTPTAVVTPTPSVSSLTPPASSSTRSALSEPTAPTAQKRNG